MKRHFHIEFGKTSDHSVDYLAGILNDAHLTTVQSITKLTFQQIDWQFRPGWNTIGAVEKLSFEDLTKKIDGHYDPLTGCNLAWALYHMVEDEIYHRGQISIIRKLYSSQHE